jgi:NAD+ synthase
MKFNRNILSLDCEKTTEQICEFICDQVREMRRNGAVVGLSGGIDSTLTASLCVKALGSNKVTGIILPEKESNPVSKTLALQHAAQLGIRTEIVDISDSLESFGVYSKRNQVIKKYFPDYLSEYKFKMVLPPDLLGKDSFNFYRLVVDYGNGNTKSVRLDLQGFLTIMAATNIKQRTRMVQLYYFAEANNYLVCGTTNKTETIQGFFVKYGDGGVDIEPIAHLYKNQVYQMAEYFGVDKRIIDRTPSPDTFSLETNDEEYYFRISFEHLDLLLYAWNNHIHIKEVAQGMSLTEEQVKRAFRDMDAKAKATKFLGILPPCIRLEQ